MLAFDQHSLFLRISVAEASAILTQGTYSSSVERVHGQSSLGVLPSIGTRSPNFRKDTRLKMGGGIGLGSMPTREKREYDPFGRKRYA